VGRSTGQRGELLETGKSAHLRLRGRKREWDRNRQPRYNHDIMSADQIGPDKRVQWAAEIVNDYVERDFKPYLDLIAKSMDRALKLVNMAQSGQGEASSDILRAVVVLNHAYLEDFLRTLGLTFLRPPRCAVHCRCSKLLKRRICPASVQRTSN